MQIEGLNIAGKKLTLGETDQQLFALGFSREAWDYNHATYDYKFVHLDDWYYLRIHTKAISGALEDPNAVLIIEEPFIGKATFPHGVDYNAEIPAQILDLAKQKLAKVEQYIAAAA